MDIIVVVILCVVCAFGGWCAGIVWCWREDLKLEDYDEVMEEGDGDADQC